MLNKYDKNAQKKDEEKWEKFAKEWAEREKELRQIHTRTEINTRTAIKKQ